ncbi:MAG: class I SAM-dependent methyltransferase [Deltaproteobacteria bacterium]|nr:class I SAM-dependent methyltransferase [Deltaproteobacteria bacterium]
MKTAKTRSALRLLAAFGAALLYCSPLQADHHQGEEKTTAALKAVIAGMHRAGVDKARDPQRHPLETLTWFGIKDNMTVVEIWPGGGWYTDILAPFLRERGAYYAAAFDPEGEPEDRRAGVQKYKEKLAAKPELLGKTTVTILAPPAKMDVAPDGSADMVLTFRNVHNWMADGQAEAVFKAMFNALKPGGILGVVEHRANSNAPQDPKAASGYVREDHVVKLAQDAGFQLVGKSEINANPKDTKDYPQGVWTLPPVLRLKEVDKEKYMAIGESDRMTLKFVKPVAK